MTMTLTLTLPLILTLLLSLPLILTVTPTQTLPEHDEMMPSYFSQALVAARSAPPPSKILAIPNPTRFCPHPYAFLFPLAICVLVLPYVSVCYMYTTCTLHVHYMTLPVHYLYRYSSAGAQDLVRTRIIRIPGGHCAFFAEVPEIATQYRKYLVQIGFLS